MRRFFTDSTFRSVVFLLLTSLGSHAADIIGSVLDANKKPISGVTVSAYRDSVLVVRNDTNSSGAYKLSVGNGPIDFIEFRKIGYHLASVQGLHDEHEKRRNSIIKLIYENPLGSTDFSIRMSILLDYERLFYYRTSPREPNRELTALAADELRDTYRPLVEKLAVPEGFWTQEQVRVYRSAYMRVATLYGVKAPPEI